MTAMVRRRWRLRRHCDNSGTACGHCAADGARPLAPFINPGIVGLKRPNRGLWLASAHLAVRLHADTSHQGNRLQPCEGWREECATDAGCGVALVASLISTVSKL